MRHPPIAMEDCILSPTKRHQHLDELREYTWQQQLLSSSAVDAATTLSPNNLLLHEYNPLVYNFEDWSKLNDLEFSLTPSPLKFEPESPISSSSISSAEDPFDDTGIDPNVLSRHLYNEPAATCRASLPDFPDLLYGQYSKPGSSRTSIDHHVLSLEEIQELCAIAMPDFELSPDSSDSVSSPESDTNPEIKSQTPKRAKYQQSTRPKAKPLSFKHQTAHNVVEKRYRNNLNNKIAALRDSVPSLRTAAKENCSDRESAESDLGGQNEPKRFNKATILSKAIEYISQLEKRTESLSKENAVLRSRAAALGGRVLLQKNRARWNPEAAVQLSPWIVA